MLTQICNASSIEDKEWHPVSPSLFSGVLECLGSLIKKREEKAGICKVNGEIKLSVGRWYYYQNT